MLLIMVIVTIILGVCLKKFNFDFKGIELVVFWIPFTICTYAKFGYDSFMNPLIFLALYYFIRMYKTRKYIKWPLFVIQIILSAIFLFIFNQYEKVVCQGWCTGGLLLFLVFLAIIAYMLAINLLNFVMNKTNPKIVKIIIKIILTIICFHIAILLLVETFDSFQDLDPWGLSFAFYMLTLCVVDILLIVAVVILIKSIVKNILDMKNK